LSTGVIGVGCLPAAGSVEYNGPIEDLIVMPYPACADQIAAWAAVTEAMPDAPAMRAEGSFDQRASVSVLGEVTGQEFIEAAIGGVFYDNSSDLSFRLLER